MKVAIIGTWHVHTKEYTAAVIDNPKAEAVCVWDSDVARGTEFAAKYELPFEPSYEKILEDKDIDSVVICTATCDHPEIIKAAAKAGKHIFTEKVLAFTKEEAVDMAKVIQEYAGKFTICYFHRTLAKVRKLKELIDTKNFGELAYMRVRNVHNGASGGWLPDTFFDKAQCGGGAMMDLGAHPMYLLNWFMGEPVSITSTFTSVTGKAVEDNAVCTIEFANGAIGVSETGFVSTRAYPYIIEACGTEGGAMIVGETVSYCCDETDNQWVTVPAEDMPADMPRPVHLWIDAVVNDTEAPFGLDDAIGLTNLMEGAYISHDKGTKHVY